MILVHLVFGFERNAINLVWHAHSIINYYSNRKMYNTDVSVEFRLVACRVELIHFSAWQKERNGIKNECEKLFGERKQKTHRKFNF